MGIQDESIRSMCVKQVIFLVDDLKLSRVDLSVVTIIINKLKDAYAGNLSIKDELTITRGKIHDYLGMSISYETTEEVCITMYDRVSELITQLVQNMIGYKKTPSADYLFRTTDMVPLLT